MPFPSRGCQTCRIRRVKCDETSPVCTQCKRVDRECIGLAEKGLQYRSENQYARGVPRRPRGGKRKQTVPAPDVVAQHKSHAKVHFEIDRFLEMSPGFSVSSISFSEAIRHSVIPPKTFSLQEIPRSLDVSLEDRAFANYAYSWIDPGSFESEHLPHNEHSYLSRILPSLENSDPASALNLAVSALSLSIFGRTRANLPSLWASAKKYTMALEKTRKLIDDPVHATADVLLVTVMLLAAYENVVCSQVDQINPKLDSYRHQRGAMVLLDLRKKLAQKKEISIENKMNLSLDKQVRRQIIRSSIHHAQALPSSFHNGAEYGENGPELDLDFCIVQVSQLRSRARKIFEKLEKQSHDVGAHENPKQGLLNIVTEAQAIDNSLAVWASSLPPDFQYIIDNKSQPMPYRVSVSPSAELISVISANNESIFYKETLHFYPSHNIAAIWNHYRAARLVLNIIIARATGFMAKDSKEKLHGLEMGMHRDIARNVVQLLVDDICYSFSFQLDGVEQESLQSSNLSRRKNGDDMVCNVTARKAFLTVWSLTIANSACELISEGQRGWVKAKIMLISKITGNGVLEALSNS